MYYISDLPTDPCANHACGGNLTCSRIGSTQKIECICPVGFSKSGQFCITGKTFRLIKSR